MMGSQGFVFPFMSFLLVTTHFLISPTLGLTSQVSELGSSFFFFGDGTYDTGNYGRLYPDSQFMHYPYGKTHYQIPTGRPSDGHLIVDYLGDKYLAQGNVITPYLQNSKSQWHFGVSFATIGASIRTDDEDLKFSKQIEHFKVVKEYFESTYGQRQTQRLLSKSVYFFSLGIVDFIKEGPLTYSRLGNASDELLHALAEAIEVIYEAGGRKFAFQNVAPLKNVPNYKLRYEDLTADCEIDANAATPLYNAFLREKIDQWATCFSNGSQWLKDFNYTYLDYYRGIQYLHDSITTNLTDACCGSGLYNGKLTCGIEDKYELCPHPNQYVWFDSAHLTDHLNDLLATEFWNGEKKYAEPYTIKEFYSGTLDDDEDGGDDFKSVAI